MAIEAPINVTPNNETVYIDKTTESGEFVNPLKCSFVFNGDNLSWWRCELYDAVTGELLGHSYAPKSRVPWTGKYRNGDTVTINQNVATELYQNGNDYKYRFILYQADSNNEPLCDMLCVTGRVIEAQTGGSTITVEQGITDIDDPYGADSYVLGYCMIEVVSESGGTLYKNKIKILHYNKRTGVITLDDTFVGEIAVGTRYKIYRNYYKTPCYFVRCREKAVVTPWAVLNEATGAVEAHAAWTINSEEEVSLQKYKWEIIDTFEGKEIYSYHDKGALPARNSVDEILDTVFPILADGDMTLKITTVTQDDFTQEHTAQLANIVGDEEDLFTVYSGESVLDGYRIVYDNGLAMSADRLRVRVKVVPGLGFTEYRLWKKKAGESHYRYVGACGASGEYIIGNDHLCDDGAEYEYIMTAKINDTIYKKAVGSITPDYRKRAVIHKLSGNGEYFGLTRYSITDSFAFDFELTEPTISINDGQTVIQTGGKPIVTAESGEYISGEFSAAITQISVTGYAYSLTDDTALYQQALAFFDNSDFLIKLPGRGCIVAGITNKSLRRNDNGATILNFSFTQIKDTGEVII